MTLTDTVSSRVNRVSPQVAEEQLLAQLPLLTQKQTSLSSFRAAHTMNRLTPLCLGALAALCAVPATAQRLPNADTALWTDARGVDTRQLPVPGFRIIDADVPTQWYAIPGLTFTTQVDLVSTPLKIWRDTFAEAQDVDTCMARQLGAIAAESNIVPCNLVANQ